MQNGLFSSSPIDNRWAVFLRNKQGIKLEEQALSVEGVDIIDALM